MISSIFVNDTLCRDQTSVDILTDRMRDLDPEGFSSMDHWWLVITTPTGGFAYDIGEDDPAVHDRRVQAAKVLHGFPDDWELDPFAHRPGWDAAKAPGEPHPTVLAGARVRPAADLDAVTQAQIDTRTAALDTRLREQRRQETIARLSDLPREHLVELAATIDTILNPDPRPDRTNPT